MEIFTVRAADNPLHACQVNLRSVNGGYTGITDFPPGERLSYSSAGAAAEPYLDFRGT